MNNLKDRIEQMRNAKITVQVAPLLYPTPHDLAERMVELLDVQQGHRVLEPSAGTGRLLEQLDKSWNNLEVVAIEINAALATGLKKFKCSVICEDFLNYYTSRKFDRIIMNPPFNGGADIKHIKHALTQLKKGGRLVALCAGGSRQEKEFSVMASHWEKLPSGTFKDAGTMVEVFLMVIEG